MLSRSRSGRDEKKASSEGLGGTLNIFLANNGVESGAYAPPAPRATSLRRTPISKRHHPRDSCAIDGRALGLKRTDDSHRSCSSALRRQRPQVRILSGAPFFHQSGTKLGTP